MTVRRGDEIQLKRPRQEIIDYIIEYADSVLAILVALVFAVLGPLGIVSQAVTNGSILGALAVLALMMLRDRANNKALRQATKNELSEVIKAILGDRDTRMDLRGIIDDIATVRILRGTEVQAAHAKAREHTGRWYFKGGTGTYLRAKTLPKCLGDRRRPIQFRIEIIDPKDSKACERYDNFRRSGSKGPDGTGDPWTPGRARLESYATILAACWYSQERTFLTIKVGLARTVSTFRYDMSSEYLIITRDDHELPAELISRGTALYAAYERELETSFGQAEPVQLDLARDVRLSAEPSPRELRTLLRALGLSPERPLTDEEATSIVKKALHATDPYPTGHEL
jgi:hypothetical protein